jgi:hypothetical protein
MLPKEGTPTARSLLFSFLLSSSTPCPCTFQWHGAVRIIIIIIIIIIIHPSIQSPRLSFFAAKNLKHQIICGTTGHYARGLAILGMKGDGGVGGGERQGAKTQGEGMGATSAGVSEGLACGVRVAVAVEGGGLEKEGMIAYDNEVNSRP